MKRSKKYLFSILLAGLSHAQANQHLSYAHITPECARALNALHALRLQTNDAMHIEGDSFLLLEDAQVIIENAISMISSVEYRTSNYEQIAQALLSYQTALDAGEHIVEEPYATTRGCKVYDSVCVKNAIGVARNAHVAGQVSAADVSASTVLTSNATTDSVNAFVLDAQIINASSIFVSEINGLPVSPSGLNIFGAPGATGPQGITGNTGPDGNAGQVPLVQQEL